MHATRQAVGLGGGAVDDDVECNCSGDWGQNWYFGVALAYGVVLRPMPLDE